MQDEICWECKNPIKEDEIGISFALKYKIHKNCLFEKPNKKNLSLSEKEKFELLFGPDPSAEMKAGREFAKAIRKILPLYDEIKS